MDKIRILSAEPIAYHEELGILGSLEGISLIPPKPSARGFRRQLGEVDVVASCLYHSSVALNAARFGPAPIAYFSDGVEEWENMCRNPLLQSKGLKQHLPAYGDIYFVCTIGARDFLAAQGKKSYMYIPKRAAFAGAGLSVASPQYDFMITTANMAYFDSSEKERLCELIELVVQAIAAGGMTCCFRIFDDEIVDACHVNGLKNVKCGSFSDVLPSVRCVLTTPSSIALTSMQANKPTALLDYRDSPMFLQAGWRVHKSSNVESVLRGMLNKDPDRMLFQATQVAQNAESSEIPELLADFLGENRKKRDALVEQQRFFGGGGEYYLRYFYRLLSKKSKALSQVFKALKRKVGR